jgi:tetratricopeptide (TPR) repeat protein
MTSADRACRRSRAQFDVYLDGELDARRTHTLEQHLAVCEPCRRLLAERRREFALLGELPLHTAPSDFAEGVMAGLADRPTPIARPAARLRPRLAWAAAGVAVAAAGIWLWALLHAPQPPGPAPPNRVVERDRRPQPNPAPVREAPQVVPVPVPNPEPPSPPVVKQPPVRHLAPRTHRPHPRAAPTPTPTPAPETEEPVDVAEIADYRDLGQAYERSGMLEEALEAYEMAAVEDDSPLATIAVARVQDQLGYTVSAIETYAETAFTDWDAKPAEEGSQS